MARPHVEHWARVRADLVRQGVIACDQACLWAADDKCVCSCGGKNHGRELRKKLGQAELPVDLRSPLARLERLDVDAPQSVPPDTVLDRLEQCELITA